ncbi:hypothetical protein NFX46_02925 [Streptomyces phaeoluteigriseus]|uniref:Secreted protein n=1 Tax=Streptomyces phaeoluteigriseus TaxID=114686 RepID=A0ABY4Z1U5_9ACTN|nr:hypothetical protein [Streptomyces phaeoluteigriseus]USQ82817.1 hypothetical protein NFX46_02925 [Streptomyces phaeoluteigriseus]
MSLRIRTRATTTTAALTTATGTVVTAAALALSGVAPASASTPAATTAAATVPWSASHATASAAGDRWLASGKLVLDGTLTNTGTGCYSVWTRFAHDFVVLPYTKHAEICGAGSVDFTATKSYTYTVTGTLRVCRGTTDTADCGPGVSITHWPIG